jgi:CHASE3 domain sensor protein
MKEQQNNLITGPYNAALQVSSDTTSKVNQLTQTLDSLNKRYQTIQNELTETQKSLNEALKQKDIADQAVNQVIQSGGGSLFGSTSSGSGNVIANITITGS